VLVLGLPGGAGAGEGDFKPQTTVKLRSGFWELNGKRTYAGSEAEGLLLNVRMVNATFEDRNPATCPKDFDPEKNTARFIDKLPDYVAHGVSAFTLSLQGGSPGYKGALNSAYERDGSLRPEYMARVARAIEACDRAGAAVILSCFYQEQDQVLENAGAVRRAVENTVDWLRARGYSNVILEIANEHPHPGFNHELIRDPDGVAGLVRFAREAAPGLLVSASGLGNGRLDHTVQSAASFILLHFNDTPVDAIQARVAAARKISKAIVCNEDRKTGAEGARALEAAVNAFASWGYMNRERNQCHPFRFEGAADDPVVYAKMKELTTPRP
jgi:hypothetical protein